MSNAIAKTENVRDIQPATTPMQLLQAAVANNVDAAQLEKLMDLQERYEANQARRAFAAAMSEFQAHCPTILKSRKADRYSYAPLDEILRTIRPHLDSAGLSVVFNTKTEGGEITAFCTVQHRDGHSVISQFSAPVDPAMKVNDTQKAGSANSYAKRYALCNALNLVGSEFDDDGFSAGVVLITDKQRIWLDENIEAYGIKVPQFCKVLNVPDLDSIPANKWGIVENAIEAKRKQVEGK